jgi:hypothetical protein
MKRHAKLACFVLLGLVASGIVFKLLSYAILFTSPGIEESETFPMLELLIISPFSLIAGGFITGFLSCPILKSKWGLFCLAPGLYFSLFFIFKITSVFWLTESLLIILGWYLFSLAGVAIGFFNRVLIKRLFAILTDCRWLHFPLLTFTLMHLQPLRDPLFRIID